VNRPVSSSMLSHFRRKASGFAASRNWLSASSLRRTRPTPFFGIAGRSAMLGERVVDVTARIFGDRCRHAGHCDSPPTVRLCKTLVLISAV
jgi:hypothetical protein